MAGCFEATVDRILARTKLTRDELMALIWKKYYEFEIVSMEGAARMVADELEGRGRG